MQVQCPVCLEGTSSPVVFGDCGHVLCSTCCPLMKSCPLCKGAARNVRLYLDASTPPPTPPVPPVPRVPPVSPVSPVSPVPPVPPVPSGGGCGCGHLWRWAMR